MHLRPYVPADASPTLAVFRRAVRLTAAFDYSPQQVEAWAGDDIDRRSWALARAATSTVVAVDQGIVVGFADITSSGYVDMLFVDPAFAGRGIATELIAVVAEAASLAGATELTVNASITARDFFEKQGFSVVAEQRPVIRGVALTNFRMWRALGSVRLARIA